ncbi:ribosomal RNA large subunit methyltransferase H [Litorimonas cladophorae]|uniref:Ribosomal RNA large subunit methyltransferase H n=1 Tax=Litorimonas cladophorae TaxID=1220491 RepID=A0A918KF80_9PROT|nr:23S rRNA (pseudouridine(1915)-N(3))-methyltransferase RlmH [Litorimonas cladophorae]GGX61247.1 ribosomal RNA large subunit methyltransferase H [Litorimonas cladophorae]
MKIILRAGNVLRNGPEKILIDDYIARAKGLARGTGFLSVEEQGIELKGQNDRSAETAKLLSGIGTSDELILLDERGKSPSSREIAKHFARLRDDSVGACYILIGGADGFEPSMVKEMRPGRITKWSFGAQTWPHKMVRVMAAEQIYRSLSILAGTPYHRD